MDKSIQKYIFLKKGTQKWSELSENIFGQETTLRLKLREIQIERNSKPLIHKKIQRKLGLSWMKASDQMPFKEEGWATKGINVNTH